MARLEGFALGFCVLSLLGTASSELLASPAQDQATLPQTGPSEPFGMSPQFSPSGPQLDAEPVAPNGDHDELPGISIAEPAQPHGDSEDGWAPWWRPRRFVPALSEHWQQQPYAAGLLAGPIWGEEIHADRVDLGSGIISGVRFGRDFDPRWGWEGRVALATFGAESLVTGQPLADADLLLADINFLAYWEWSPRLHPFFSMGTGLALWDYSDVGTATTETTLLFPIGLGLKYSHDERMGIRLDFQDNISLAQKVGIDTVHSLTLNFGFEFRFGGSRPSYDSWAR